jgi:multiple sugar transport system ATP-binding protein
MGRAIVRQPLAFLLDEPLSNLDAKLRVQMRTELARLQRRLGTTMVYVTHDQTEAMTLGERIAVLRAGEIQQVGAPRELYQRPANLFVAGFIGSPAMNRLPVRVDGGRLVFPMTEIGLPERFRGRLAGETRSLIAGVRPEHFVSGSDAEPGEGRFEVRVEVIEWLGADVFVHFDVSGGRLEELRGEPDLETGHEGRLRMVARVPGDIRFREGERTDLYLDPRGLLLFDDRTGERIG